MLEKIYTIAMAIYHEFFGCPSHVLMTLFFSLIISSVLFVCCYIIQKIRWRTKYSALLPGLKLRFSDVLSGAKYIYFNEESRRGRSIQAVFFQLMAGNIKLYEDHKLVCIWLAYHPMVIPLKGEAVEVMLKDSALLNKNFMYKQLIPFFGAGLITSSGDEWKSRRKMINPCFHWEILKEYIPIFNEQATKLVKNLQKVADGQIIELKKPLFHCLQDIVCETMMGVKIGAQDNNNMQYVDAIASMKKVIMIRAITWWMWPDFIFQYTESNKLYSNCLNIANNFTNQILQQKKKQYMSRGPKDTELKRKSFLEFLLEHHIDIQSISEEDIKGELNTFIGAANDTSVETLNYVLYFLGQYKDIQDNARREVDRIFGDDKVRPAEKDDISGMNYIECVIKETLRIYPSIPVIARTVSTDIVICGYTIPKGSTCAISPYFLHRDPEAFPNPEIFDPSRFFPENCAKRHPFSYIPFSAGPRNCIGQKFAMMVLKTVTSTVLRHFTVESLDHRDRLDLLFDITLKTSTPLKFRLKPRV